MRALDDYPVKQLILAGGVAANHGLRTRLDHDMKEFHPDVPMLQAPLKLQQQNLHPLRQKSLQLRFR